MPRAGFQTYPREGLEPKQYRSHGVDSGLLGGIVRLLNHRPWHNFHLAGTGSFDLVDHLPLAGWWKKMSKYSVQGGNVAGLLQRFS